MTRNPYAFDDPIDQNPRDPRSGGGGDGNTPVIIKQRTSVLAILALVFPILCCVPGFGLIGVIFGGLAMIGIWRSRGRIGGTALAIIGIVIGVFTTIVWIGILVGLSVVANEAQSKERFLLLSHAGDVQGARSMLSPAASNAASDEQIIEFADAFGRDWGVPVESEQGMLAWAMGFVSLEPEIQRVNSFNAEMQSRGYVTLPVPATTDRGERVLVIVLSRDSGSGTAPIDNIGYFDDSGEPVWLLPDPRPNSAMGELASERALPPGVQIPGGNAADPATTPPPAQDPDQEPDQDPEG